jgi:hypothetical protein
MTNNDGIPKNRHQRKSMRNRRRLPGKRSVPDSENADRVKYWKLGIWVEYERVAVPFIYLMR